jgi:hypothetical protein
VKTFLTQSQKHMTALEAQKENSTAFSSDQERLEMLQHTVDNPKLYSRPTIPAIWKATTVRNLPESIMHFAMNLQKTILQMIFEFANSKSMGTFFVGRCAPVLAMVQKLAVSSAPVRTFKNNKFGGFVAENYRAVTMILPWFSNILLEKEFDGSSVSIDYSLIEERPLDKWTVPCIKHWLRARGFEVDRDWNKPELLEELRNHHGKSNLPIVDEPTPPTCTALEIRELVYSAHKLFGTLFATDQSGEAGANRYSAIARRFMSILDKVEFRLDPNRKKPIWISKYNTIGAFRVAELFVDHNLARNMHEGGELGEGVVKELRAYCPQAVKDGWSKNLIRRYYRGRAMTTIYREVDGREPLPSIPKQVLSKFRRYKSEHDVRSNIMNGGVLSALAYWDNETNTTNIGVVIDNQGWYFFQIYLDYSTVQKDISGFTYFGVILRDGNRRMYGANPLSLDLGRHCIFRKHVLLLPYLWHAEAANKFSYAIVSEDWDYLDTEGWVNA